MHNPTLSYEAFTAKLALLILCIVFISGMLLQFIIFQYHTILNPFVLLDIVITFPLMIYCVARIKKIYAHIIEENIALQTKINKLLSSFDVINFGVAIMLADGSLFHINKKMCRLLGFSQQDMRLKDIEKLLHMDELRNNKKFIENLLERGIEKYQTIIQCKNRNGDLVWMTATISLITNSAGALQHLVVQTQKLFSRTKSEDVLAGASGFASLEKKINKSMKMADNDLTKIVFIYLSTNVSEDLSRLIGPDGLLTFLKIFSKRIRNTIRDTDYIAQENNGDFLICMINVNEFSPDKIITNITKSLTSPLVIKGSEIIISVNYGISIFPHDGDNFTTLLRNAELACQKAKLSKHAAAYYIYNADCPA